MTSLKGSSVLVTGASRGIGKAIAVAMANAGARVALVADSDSTEVCRLITDSGGEARTYSVDVSEEVQVRELFEAVLSDFGTVNVLVNNAGAIRAEAFPNVSEETWDWSTSLNMKGLYFSMQRAAIHMMQQRSGTIINIASIAGFSGGMTLSPPYAASKSAVINLTKVAASKLAVG